MSYLLFEHLYADALRAEDPVEALWQASLRPELSAELRAAMQSVDPDGLRMTALLVAKLRFERLIRGSAEADAFWGARPAELTVVFRRYHHEVPMTAFFPPDEAACFAAWCERNGVTS
ncbi:MAG: hypothetical protein IT378_23800 [Sandaracinaceae bacterium]|nr:hypothetical protein [Sandaracinaceae bacterium]